uniref:Myosin motor domain-containing protein n=1 Tax=Plectus sambesii TaxID=2011161 RepID=A0A914XMV5_9BILA
MFGLTDGSRNSFETLCINLVSEKLRQFYQARTFLDVQSKMASEGLRDCADFQLQDGPEILEAFLAPKIGLLYLLDEECEKANGSPTHFLDNVKTQQKDIRSLMSVDSQNLLVRHYGGRSIRYDCATIVATNRNRLTADLVSIFNKNTCNFGFVSYLFTSDVEACAAESNFEAKVVPYVGPAGHTGTRPATFSEDFAYQIDSFLRAAAIGKLHFVHCIKSNSLREYQHLDVDLVRQQVTRSDLVQMFSVVSAGFPYSLTVEEFNERYRFLLKKYYPAETELSQDALEKTKLILECYLKAVDESSMPYVSNQWALGKKHIFLSHGAQQQLNLLKFADSSARPSPNNNNNNDLPSTLTPEQLLRKTAATLGIEPSSVPPPLPANRLYTVNGSRKHCFPQRRVMIEKFSDPTTGAEFRPGDVVTVLGVSANSTHLVINSGSGRTSIVPARSTRLTIRS